MGFMGSGKSVVGRQVARRLGWRFLDMDDAVESAAGRPIAEIFEAEGEGRFRELEHEAARRLLGEERAVLASGGGWPCVPGRMDELDSQTLSIWLQVSAVEAVHRVEASRSPRPLLQVEDPETTAQNLLSARERFYRKADWTVDTDGRSAAEVAREIVGRLTARGDFA